MLAVIQSSREAASRRSSTTAPTTATVTTDPATLGAVQLGGRLAEAERAGDLAIEGDRKAVKRLAGLFPQPEPAVPA